ncbi:hypothetical protein G3I55_36505, partial [Streptomyces sp. SID6648]|nr:hypothetical protein [Streptomyces sp. SID6648]
MHEAPPTSDPLEAACWALDLIRETEGSLVLVTRGAVATVPGEPAEPAMAAVWGLARSAQAEEPSRRITLVDLAPGTELPPALPAGEPQLAVRDDVLAPRL